MISAVFFFLVYSKGIMEIEFVLQDITTSKSEAIVNAANEDLRGGGGVDGAIHEAAGEELDEECKTLGGCLPGQAKITKGYHLPARYIIHTVGPRYYSSSNPSKVLTSCYKNCLLLADTYGIFSIAFPSISTGVFGYPISEASIVAIEAIENYFSTHQSHIQKVTFCLFSKSDLAMYEESYASFLKKSKDRQ